jgi:DegV family protein with EDD domain
MGEIGLRKIVVDSGCDISDETIAAKNINLQRIPLTMRIGEEDFVDDENLNIDLYLEKMFAHKEAVKTSAPSPELYKRGFEGAQSVYVVTISQKLSGSYNSAVLGRRLTLDEDPDKFIHIIDSKSASAGMQSIVLKIQEFIQKNFTDLEIVEKIGDFLKNFKTYILLERYDNLVKTGRIRPYIARIASILSIKPICYAKDGEIEMLDKVRGYKKAVSRLIEIMINDKVDFASRVLSISHVRCYEKAVALKAAILDKIKFKEVIITNATGLCTTYANKGGIVISY